MVMYRSSGSGAKVLHIAISDRTMLTCAMRQWDRSVGCCYCVRAASAHALLACVLHPWSTQTLHGE